MGIGSLVGCQMIIAISIAVTLVVGYISYRIIFTGFADFREGFDRFFNADNRNRTTLWSFDYTDDQNWSSGIRFFIFILFPLAAGVLTYLKLYINSH